MYNAFVAIKQVCKWTVCVGFLCFLAEPWKDATSEFAPWKLIQDSFLSATGS